MDNLKKFEQLIDLVINEGNEQQANELFHEIVVEKSRTIFESIMAEEMEDDMDEGMGGQVGDLLDEINAEESGIAEEEEDEDEMDFGGEEDIEFGDEDESDLEGEDEVEDAVIRIEDKLDQLMAEFEEIMGGGAGEEDFGDEEGSEEDFGDEGNEEDMMEDEMDEDEMDESDASVMEAVQLQKVSVTHGDNGAYTKSPNTNNSGQAGMDSKPVKFAGDAETVPTGPKAGQVKDLKGAGSFKNAPGHRGQDLSAAPKPKHSDDGANTKSPVAESRRSARRPIR